MEEQQSSPAPSKLTILGSPLHPMVVNFPIALHFGAALSDTAAWVTKDPFYARMSKNLLAGAVGSMGPATGSGLLDFLLIRKVREHLIAWVHLLGMDVALVLAVVNLARRVGHGPKEVRAAGVAISWTTALLVGFSSYFGGRLAHIHGISMGERSGDE